MREPFHGALISKVVEGVMLIQTQLEQRVGDKLALYLQIILGYPAATLKMKMHCKHI
jgi:hypothetical protein